MLRFMLDTNFCIHILRDRPQALRLRMNSNADALCISTIVQMELLQGAALSARKDHNRLEVERFCARLEVLAFDENAAAHAADIRAKLQQRGQPIGAYDSLIAGHARSFGLIIVTHNMREFTRVEGLRCEDWQQTETKEG
jgi:tRNA(fMet)-specific endonuclease VapC